MKILVLGGTKFLGRHIVTAACDAGHAVTLFHRGQTNPDLFPDLQHLIGDRDGNLDALTGHLFDAVIDTSGYVPRIVRQSVQMLQEVAAHYTFISSISVYADFSKVGVTENDAVLRLADRSSEDKNKYYGELKALCEEEVMNAFGNHALIIRPGSIVGPNDPTDRFTYWPHRFAKGGQVLTPGNPDQSVQFIDVRDLATWIVHMVEQRASGTFNATGPADTLTMEAFVAACMQFAPDEVEAVWVSEDFLLENDIQEWSDMPLWISEATNWPGFSTADITSAKANGLTFRPLAETIEATIAFADTLPEDRDWHAGLTRSREQDLLTKWLKHIDA